jgi:hypothetical protein
MSTEKPEDMSSTAGARSAPALGKGAAAKNGRRAARPSHQLVFLIGTYFSGSTLLGNCLNAHPSIFFAGEVDRLEAFRREPDWTHQREKGCRLCSTQAESNCPAWPSEFLEKIRPLDDLSAYRAVIERTEAPILLDGSKRIDWLNSLYDSGLKSNVKAIICARTPFSFAKSSDGGTQPIGPMAAATSWRDFYLHALRSLAGRGIPSLVVRYEDFAFKPEPSIRRVCEFLNIPFDPVTLNYWQVPSHAVGGNGGAYLRNTNFTPSALDKDEKWKLDYFSNKPFGGWIEDKWIDGLTDAAVRQIMSVPMLNDVASLLGYDLAWFLAERTRIRTEIDMRRAAQDPEARESASPRSIVKAA